MKEYVKPELNCIEVRPEERLAAVCEKIGACTGPVTTAGYEEYWGMS